MYPERSQENENVLSRRLNKIVDARYESDQVNIYLM